MTEGPITYREMGSALHETVRRAGHRLWCENGQWFGDDATSAQAIVDAFDPLTQARRDKLAVLATVFSGKFDAGFVDPVSGRVVQIDDASQQNIAAKALQAVVLGAAWPSDLYWIAADNTHIPLASAPAMLTLANAAGTYVTGLILTNRAKKDAIAAAGDAATLAAIDPAAGWPSNP